MLRIRGRVQLQRHGAMRANRGDRRAECDRGRMPRPIRIHKLGWDPSDRALLRARRESLSDRGLCRPTRATASHLHPELLRLPQLLLISVPNPEK
jgi:hypothetical protein